MGALQDPKGPGRELPVYGVQRPSRKASVPLQQPGKEGAHPELHGTSPSPPEAVDKTASPADANRSLRKLRQELMLKSSVQGGHQPIAELAAKRAVAPKVGEGDAVHAGTLGAGGTALAAPTSEDVIKQEVLKVLPAAQIREGEMGPPPWQESATQGSTIDKIWVPVRGPPGERGISKSEEDLVGVFSKLKMDHELHRDDLPKALELARFTQPNPRWIEQAYQKFEKFSTLSQDEFVSFVRDYEEQQRVARAEAFRRLDSNHLGMLDAGGLTGILKTFGVEPMKHVLEEVIAEVSRSGSGRLEFDDFEMILELLQAREGFSKRDFDLFMHVFSKFDTEGSGFVNTSKFTTMLAFLGFSWSESNATRIHWEVDVNRSGKLSGREFLLCLRKVRERELEKIGKALAGHTMDKHGRVRASACEHVFRLLGYVPDMEAIQCAADEAEVPLVGDLDLGDLWGIMTVYRSREGFSGSDEAYIRTAFAKCDPDNRGFVTWPDIGKILRDVGSPKSFEVRQDLLSKIDITSAGQLDYPDTRKFVRMCRELENFAVQGAFASKANGNGEVPRKDVIELLDSLNLEDAPDFPVRKVVLELNPKDQFNFADFTYVTNCLSKATRATCRANGGFTAEEMRDLTAQFKWCARGGPAVTQVNEVRRFIDRLLPVLSRHPVTRCELEKTLEDAIENASGGLDFEDFLRLIVRLREMQDAFRFQKETAAIKQTGFSRDEVKHFRECFIDCDADKDGELSLAETLEMVKTLLTVGSRELEEFRSIFVSATPWQFGADGRVDYADFPEFLLLMRKMMDRNFSRIIERSQKLAKDAEAEAAEA